MTRTAAPWREPSTTDRCTASVAAVARDARVPLVIDHTVATPYLQRVKEFGADTVEPGKAHAVECDIFAPCAMGAVVNDDTLPELKCAAIAGSANNVLARDEHGYALRQLGILYAPDYVVNAGGLINVADELEGYSPERAKAKVEGIFGAVKDIFHRAKADGVPTSEAADRIAKDRMRDISRLRLIRVLPGVSG